MQTSFDCIPCFVRQALEAGRFVTDDPVLLQRVLQDVCRLVSELDLAQSPPAVAQRIHRRIRGITGVDRPYARVKERFNRVAMELLGEMEAKVAAAADPLAMAVRLAIAGNVVDLGVNGSLAEAEVRLAAEQALTEPAVLDLEAFRQAVTEAESILYLTDNAGEIVFDRLLVQQLPAGRVTVAVRGGDVINDATLADAQVAGLCERVPVIDNGSDAPGTILRDCSEEFRERFRQADVVIAKGQGNFETLSDEPGNIFFLFKTKCPVIAAKVGLEVGTHVLRRSAAASDKPAAMPPPTEEKECL